MRFKTQAVLLKPFVDATASIVPKNNKRPQLECTRIDVDRGVVTLSATNLNETIRLVFSDECETEDGSVFLPSVNLQRTIKEAGKSELDIKWNGKTQKAACRFDNTLVNLPVEPPEDLPNIPRFSEKGSAVTIPGPALTAILSRAVFSVQSDFVARALAGVSVKIRKDEIELAATNGMGIAVVRHKVGNPDGLERSAILPPVPPKIVAWIAPEPDDVVEFQLVVNQLRLRGPRGELSFRLMAGQFPDYEDHVPEKLPKSMDIERKPLLEMLEQSKLLKVVGLTRYKFTLTTDRLEMVAASGVDGKITAALEVPWSWEDTALSLDPNLMIPVLKAMKATHVVFGVAGPEEPVLFREVTDKFSNRYMLSPRFE